MRPSWAARLAGSLLGLAAAAAVVLAPSRSAPPPTTWEALIAPLAVGQPVTRGFVLSPPRRGEIGDVVYVARRDAGSHGPAGRIEIHILDRGRWSEVRETRSFGIAYEVPKPGSPLPWSDDDARAVTSALGDAVARNDRGFASVESIPLAGEPGVPQIARVLERLNGWRGVVAGGLIAVALSMLGSLRGGTAAVAIALFALGLVLRGSALDLPFQDDQDVQRMLTGRLPLEDIATGSGLLDRHPPLYFFVLHGVQRWGQSEAVGRAPAVFAGALLAPAVLLAAIAMGGRGGPAAILAALAVAVSPVLIARSREVSEIPLFALIVIAAVASLVAALRAARWPRLAVLAASHALALYTYYLAPFVVAAHALLLLCLRRRDRVLATFVAGVLAGVPALLLAAATLFRDRGAREVARIFPGLAWGEHAPPELAAHMARIAVEAFGLPFLSLLLVAIAAGVWARKLAVLAPAAATAATVAGILLLSPVARVQAYYVATVLPLAALAIAALEPRPVRLRRAWEVALGLTLALSTVPLLATARPLYVPSLDAFMPRFAALIAQRPEGSVVTVAQYDKTLLAYYLARGEGRPIDWHSLESPRVRVEALILVHDFEGNTEAAAARRLDEIIAAGPTLVIERDRLLLPRIVERLARCEQLLQAPSARLLRCS